MSARCADRTARWARRTDARRTAAMALLVLALLIAPAIAVAGDPAAALRWRDVAQRRYVKRDLAGAHQALGRALALDPENAQFHFMDGNALFRLARYRPAAEAYRRAAALRSDHPDTWLGLGFARYYLGDLNAAVTAWEEAVRLQPHSAFSRLALALGYAKQGEGYYAGLQREWAQAEEPGCDAAAWLARDVRWKPREIELVRSIEIPADAAEAESDTRSE